ncbi:MAG: Phospho-2-dehydro-3-deoxyheptonate aldolase [bacterium ADurb.Bin429]|nr:MAG: Phospho-2-dehydro-3-deoxyheptonate aldolase [bacterium ADurb.Bin429]
MIIIMEEGAPRQAIDEMIAAVEAEGFQPFVNPGVERTVIAVLGVVNVEKVQVADKFASFPGVERVALVSEPYKLASRAHHPAGTVLNIRGVTIGGTELCIMAGPCSVESREQTLEIAHAVKEAGAHMLRGGAFKPRTSPYAFQGLGVEGLKILAEAREQTGLPVVTEVMDHSDVEQAKDYADILQIGARNMQNFRLLRCVGATNLPVLLKRGFGCKVEDLLMAAEYIMAEGNAQVILCERGIITFETSTRFTTDINAVPVIKHHSHLPIVVDPSHAAGDWRYVASIALAGIAAGADGLEVEVHNNPAKAKSDSAQALTPEKFDDFMRRARLVAAAVDRTIGEVPVG